MIFDSVSHAAGASPHRGAALRLPYRGLPPDDRRAARRRAARPRVNDEREIRPDLFFAQGGQAQKRDRRPWPLCPGRHQRGRSRRGEGRVCPHARAARSGRALLGPSEIQITEDLFIGPTTRREREGGMMQLNHCCEPNLGLQGQVVYVALRDIRMGEELTADYAMTDDEPYEMTCRRGR